MIIQRTERHTINKNHLCFKAFDEICFKSKNIYNYANYIIRQEFINNKKYIKYNDLTSMIKHSEPFMDLGSNSAQHTLKMLDKSWKSFFISIKDYSKNPSKYLGRPKLPKYKDKNGRHICVLTNMQTHIKDNYLYFAYTILKPFNNLFRTKINGKLLQTRIIPKGGCYILEIVYEKEIQGIPQDFNSNKIFSIDLGLNNFATITNNIGIKPIVINGKGIKSYNKYWNKRIAELKSILKKVNNLDWSKQLSQLTDKRNNIINNYVHQVSAMIIKLAKIYNIDTIVCGYNQEWKQDSKMCKKVNQTFVQIPYYEFIQKLQYKCEDNNIKCIMTEESYTSGTSFLDNEQPCKENYDKKRRVVRGLFKSNNATLINSDVNGSFQIMKKVFPNFTNGIVGVDFHPIILNVI